MFDFLLNTPLLAQRDEDVVVMLVMMVVMLFAMAVGIGIAIFIILFLSSCLKRVPPQFREMEPGMVWLLLIPCFSIVWNFYVYSAIPRSFQNYFNSIGRYDVGDCGAQLGQWYAILTVVSIVPIVNYIAGPAAFIVWIIFLVKAGGLKSQIPENAEFQSPMPYGYQKPYGY
jgi:hypothetical protein